MSTFFAKQYTATAHFGDDAPKAFALFGQSLGEVRSAAWMLMRLVGENDTDPEFTNQLLRQIWAPYSKLGERHDDVAGKIENAVSLIEGFCRPVLEWRGAA